MVASSHPSAQPPRCRAAAATGAQPKATVFARDGHTGGPAIAAQIGVPERPAAAATAACAASRPPPSGSGRPRQDPAIHKRPPTKARASCGPRHPGPPPPPCSIPALGVDVKHRDGAAQQIGQPPTQNHARLAQIRLRRDAGRHPTRNRTSARIRARREENRPAAAVLAAAQAPSRPLRRRRGGRGEERPAALGGLGCRPCRPESDAGA
ncbi:hypothetical protein ACP70R_001197 [Stipagrostis hirtigluma subsp. patula]